VFYVKPCALDIFDHAGPLRRERSVEIRIDHNILPCLGGMRLVLLAVYSPEILGKTCIFLVIRE
jgi:hypothetical protein